METVSYECSDLFAVAIHDEGQKLILRRLGLINVPVPFANDDLRLPLLAKHLQVSTVGSLRHRLCLLTSGIDQT